MNVDEVHTIAWVQSRSVTVGKQLKVTKVNKIAIGNLNYIFKKITYVQEKCSPGETYVYTTSSLSSGDIQPMQ